RAEEGTTDGGFSQLIRVRVNGRTDEEPGHEHPGEQYRNGHRWIRPRAGADHEHAADKGDGEPDDRSQRANGFSDERTESACEEARGKENGNFRKECQHKFLLVLSRRKGEVTGGGLLYSRMRCGNYRAAHAAADRRPGKYLTVSPLTAML